ncbi:MAG: adenylate/guanylate cyclase domain-containing protein, partial [Nitrosotalea sp.]
MKLFYGRMLENMKMDLNGNNTILPELDKMINETMKIMQIFKIHSKRRVETMAIFDQVDSTGSKMKLGHDEATQKIFHHNIICRQIVKKMNGTVIKDTGDGVLTRFLDPMNACLCAINIQHAINKADIVTRGALSMGMVEEAHFTDYVDLYGTAVDLCSRIEKCALPNQILIDKTLYDSINTFLRDHDDIHVSE